MKMDKLENLSVIELEGKKKSLAMAQVGIRTIGLVGGWIYANKTGGGFLRYVGFGIVGSTATGLIGYFTLMQRINKIETQIALKKSVTSDEKKENDFFKQGGVFR